MKQSFIAVFPPLRIYCLRDHMKEGAYMISDGNAAVRKNDEAGEAQGYLRVRVSTARRALPVCGAHVFVTPCENAGERGVTAASETDESGLSRLFTLRTESLSGAGYGKAPPCARYDIEVIAEGFESASFCFVPIYAGVTSVQCAEMIPKIPGGRERE